MAGGRILRKSMACIYNSIPAVSEWVATVPKTSAQSGWPALMVVTTTQNYQAAEGALYAYNLANGLKRILILEGVHGSSVFSDNGEILKRKAVEFAADCLMNRGVVDTRQMTMQQLVCSTPHIRTDVPHPPPHAGHLASYYAQLKHDTGSEEFEQHREE
jgi:hypothetical protein